MTEIDPVTYLTMRHHRDDEVRQRVLELADLDDSSAWRVWLRDTEERRELLGTNGCFGWSVIECFTKAFERHRAEPIPFLANEPDWVDVP